MADLDLEAVEARADAATPGPWYASGELCPNEVYTETDPGATAVATCWMNHDQADGDTSREVNNAAFIAHAREDVPALLAEVDRLTAENARLRNEIDAAAMGER